MTDWAKYDYNTTETFSLKNTEFYARVVQIYDGDTITAVIPLFGNFYKFSIRLNGIDTCEIKSTNKTNRDMSIDARNRLVELITDNKYQESVDIKKNLLENIFLVYLRCDNFDKYGRILATVSKNKDDKVTFSDILINEKLAYAYDGKKKLTEEEQINILK